MKVYIGRYPKHWPWSNWLYSAFGYEAQQTIDVHIDKWDTWSMDHTLAHIVLPMLIQLRDTSHSFAFVEEEDAPAELGEEQRWNYVLNEMIFAFAQKVKEEEEFDQDRVTNGFRLFGKYYEALWD